MNLKKTRMTCTKGEFVKKRHKWQFLSPEENDELQILGLEK